MAAELGGSPQLLAFCGVEPSARPVQGAVQTLCSRRAQEKNLLCQGRPRVSCGSLRVLFLTQQAEEDGLQVVIFI